MRRFQKNNTLVVWGDALDVLDQVAPDDSVNLIFADPPYNIGAPLKIALFFPKLAFVCRQDEKS
jgi:DNA modification methylase